MLWVWLVFAVFAAAADGSAEEAFGAELRRFLESHEGGQSHCGVGFDTVSGHALSSVSLFVRPRFRLDPFVAQHESSCAVLPSLSSFFALLAHEQRLDHRPGMFVRSALPHFAPEHESSPALMAVRTEAALGIVLDATTTATLVPELQIALAQLPARFDPVHAKLWAGESRKKKNALG